MSILDSIMGQMGGGVGQAVEAQVAGMIAQKMGIDPSLAQMAITALTAAHPQPSDTVATATANTPGVSTDMMSQILSHLGGEGVLTQLGAAMNGQQTPGEVAAAGGSGGIGDVLTGVLGNLMGGQKS